MKHNNRNLREPRQQVKASLYIFTTLTALFTMFSVVILRSIQGNLAEMAAKFDVPSESVNHILSSIMLLMSVTLLFSGVAILLVFVGGYILEQRVFGPVVPIRNLIAKLQNGNYAARGSLRKYDEFQEVMNDVNALAAKLEAKN